MLDLASQINETELKERGLKIAKRSHRKIMKGKKQQVTPFQLHCRPAP